MPGVLCGLLAVGDSPCQATRLLGSAGVGRVPSNASVLPPPLLQDKCSVLLGLSEQKQCVPKVQRLYV